MNSFLIKNATIINEERIFKGSVFLMNGRIDRILQGQFTGSDPAGFEVINANGKYLIPGVIDDQVHFREPGLTHKADIATESAAAVAGGVTSFMEMPNTKPQTTTLELLEEKHEMAAPKSMANYSFYLGATNDNLDQIRKIEPLQTCGVKVFMGASTGNMLVDNPETLEGIFSESPVPIATHCEDEQTIRDNARFYKEKYGENLPFNFHPLIRNEEACYKSSSLAVNLAVKYNSRLHILHLSTRKELGLFDPVPFSSKKRITSEVCIHHLWFDNTAYENLGAKIKWNPAIKTAADKESLLEGLRDNRIDVVATDHAPHTLEEKQRSYFDAPSGGPMVQHSLVAMFDLSLQHKITPEIIVKKMCHIPADLFNVVGRGYIRKGYWADLVILDPDSPWTVNKDNILYKCKWSPLENYIFKSKVLYTFVNGNLVYQASSDNLSGHILNSQHKGMRLQFLR